MKADKTTNKEAQELAEKSANAMFLRDNVAKALGIHIEHIAPGRATLSMTLRPNMVNGHHIAHGGMIFTLADTAFAYACNSYNLNTVASACHIDFLAAARVGETLTATALEQTLAGRSGVYDVDIKNKLGDTIAMFRGKSARISGEVIA